MRRQDGPTFWERFEHRIVNNPNQFLEEVRYIAHNKIKGAYIQIDEAGVSMANTGWYEQWAKSISATVQIIGYLNPFISIVAPQNEFVLSVLRKMLNNLYNCSRFSNDYAIVKPYQIQYNAMFRKYMYPRPSIKFAGQKYLLTKMIMPLPPKFLLERYINFSEPKKDSEINKQLELVEKSQMLDKGERHEISFDEQVEFLVKNYPLFEAKSSNKAKEGIILDTALIRYKMDKGELPDRKARALKSEAEKRLNEKLRVKKEELANLERKIKGGA